MLACVLLAFWAGSAVGGGPSKAVVSCGACKLLVEEAENFISAVDPEKKVTVGSHRVGPKGDQYLSSASFARSSAHLHEVLEKVCDAARHFALAAHPASGRTVAVRTSDFGGSRPRRLTAKDASSETQGRLKHACHSILEEEEEGFLELLATPRDDAAGELCVRRLRLCEEADLEPMDVEYEPEPEPTTPAPAPSDEQDVSGEEEDPEEDETTESPPIVPDEL